MTLQEIEALKAERNALAAQVNFLLEVIDSSGVYKVSQELCDARHKTPQQCLRDVQAKAAYSGYVAGWSFQQKPLEPAATQYAESVRQGGE